MKCISTGSQGVYCLSWVWYNDLLLQVSLRGSARLLRQNEGASAHYVDSCELWLSPQVGSTVAIKGGNKRNSKYCADEYNRVKCNRNAVGQWEKFTVVSAGGGRIGLRGGKNNKYCADEGNRGIKCNRNWVRGWEKFRVVDGGSGKIALRGGKHNKVCADEYHITKCNRNSVQGWEKFTIECLSGCATEEESRSLEEVLGEAQSSHKRSNDALKQSSDHSGVDKKFLSLFERKQMSLLQEGEQEDQADKEEDDEHNKEQQDAQTLTKEDQQDDEHDLEGVSDMQQEGEQDKEGRRWGRRRRRRYNKRRRARWAGRRRRRRRRASECCSKVSSVSLKFLLRLQDLRHVDELRLPEGDSVARSLLTLMQKLQSSLQ